MGLLVGPVGVRDILPRVWSGRQLPPPMQTGPPGTRDLLGKFQG